MINSLLNKFLTGSDNVCNKALGDIIEMAVVINIDDD